MQLTYNSVALHSIGTLQIGAESSEFIPPELPQRRRVRLTVTIDVFAQTWAENRTALEGVRTALANPQATLLWYDETASKTVLNQTVTVVSHDFPQDPNAWGTYHQTITIAFLYEDSAFSPSLFTITYTPDTGSPVTLTGVQSYKPRFSVDRYSPLRDLRSRASGRVDFAGQIILNESASLSSRRTAAVAAVAGLTTALMTKHGTLLYQTSGATQIAFNKVVRVSDFHAEVDQLAGGAVNWSLSADYTQFPNEASYGAADFSCKNTLDTFGQKVRVLSGRIGAQDESTALTKLASLRSAWVSGLLRLTSELDSRNIDADDGTTFVELSFNETYRVDRPTDDQIAIKFQYVTEIDYRTRAKRSTLSGTAEADTATNAQWAVAQIVALYSLGSLVTGRDTEMREKNYATKGSSGDDQPASGTGFVEFSFDRVYEGTLSGSDQVLESEVSEEITFSGTRWVNRPTAYGRDVMQACGYEPGQRTIAGRVFATTEALALAFARRQFGLPWYGSSPHPSAPGSRYVKPATFTSKPRILPGVEAVIRSTSDTVYTGGAGSTNAQGYEVTFKFSEVLPTYDMV